jgi:cell division protein FtsB
MRAIVIFLIVTLISLQYKLWLGDGSVRQWVRMEKKLDEQEKNNQTLITRNHTLEADIEELKSGDQALEEQARYELGMVKDGETYYQFVE